MGEHFRIAVIGAGVSGILALIKLREAGYDDVVCLEKAEDLGGTWRDNCYPGLTCDVPSLAYRYSFAPNAEWSHVCASGGEILSYVRGVAERYGVEGAIRYGHEVTSAARENGRWRVTTSGGLDEAFDIVLTATGVLHHPVKPDIVGLENFAGACFHTAEWDDSVSLAGKRVGVIGTGSTATQITGAVVGEAAHFTLFQRTAQWILPLANPEIAEDEKQRYRDDPRLLDMEYERLNDEQGTKFAAAIVGENPRVYATLERLCRENLETSVADEALRRKLTPDYKVGCKRLIMSDRFYHAIQQPNAELVAEAIVAVEPGGVRTADGRLHELDVLVLATGFDTHRFFRPMHVVNQDGVTLDEAWAEGNVAYMAVATPGFPNWFMIGGPNSPIGNYSWMMTAENQLGYIIQLIGEARAGGALAPRPEATEAFNAAIASQITKTIWASGCRSWYIDAKGRVASWPWTYEKFLADMSRPVLEDFERERVSG